MKIIETITSIKNAIDMAAAQQSDGAWQEAVSAAGLVSQGNQSDMGIDEEYVGTFDGFEVRLQHTWRDTSKPFAPGPDRTRLRFVLRHKGAVLDTYTTGYDN